MKRLPKFKFSIPKLNIKKIELKRKQIITIIAVLTITVITVMGRESPLGNKWEDVLPDSSIFDDIAGTRTVDDDKYTAFFFEIYDLIKNKHWNNLSDEQLGNVAKLAIEKLTEEAIPAAPATRDALGTLLKETMRDMTEEEKKEFTVQLSDIILANLEPFGRSRLYNSKKQKELADTVKNINPNVNHYDSLEVEKEASIEAVALAYQNKVAELNQKEQTPEVKQEKVVLEKAFEVLGDSGNKNVYDELGVDPTIENRLISPRIFYIHITKFSPTTVEELQRVMDKVDQGNELDTLIIDLRGNIGGAIDGLPYFLGPFIGPNQYAYQFFSRGEKEDFTTKTGWMTSLIRYKKVVILIDGEAQSSAEVFASVLKKYNVGVVVGEPTKGWGSVESVFKLNNQLDPENETYSVLLVHSLTLREDGVPIEGKGVDPMVNITSVNWRDELYRYFNYQELVNAVSNLVN